MFKVLVALLSVVLMSCVPSIKPPETYYPNNEVYIKLSKDEVWKKCINSLADSIFSINAIDKDAGLINISYSGDPEEFVDCGTIKEVGKKEHPVTKSNYKTSVYVVLAYEASDIRMFLNGKINILINEITDNLTYIKVTSKYALTKVVSSESMVLGSTPSSRVNSQTIYFTTLTSAKFPSSKYECVPTGKLEKLVIEILTKEIDPNLISFKCTDFWQFKLSK